MIRSIINLLAGVWGEAISSGVSGRAARSRRSIGRLAVLAAGWPYETPGFTLNRFCGSGQTRSDPGGDGRADRQSALITMCTGGGMGTATIIERI